MRFFGLSADVMAKFGVTTQLPAGDVYPALEQGLIDAIEYSVPAIDVDLGFDRLAKPYYFPGWHQQATILELLVNQEAWNAPRSRRRTAPTCSTPSAEGVAIQYAALAELQARGGDSKMIARNIGRIREGVARSCPGRPGLPSGVGLLAGVSRRSFRVARARLPRIGRAARPPASERRAPRLRRGVCRSS
jgi:hypothetical protein